MNERERAADAYANWQEIRHAERTAGAIGPKEVYRHIFEGGLIEQDQWRYLWDHPGLVNLLRLLAEARSILPMRKLAAASSGAVTERRSGPVLITVSEDPELSHLKRVSLTFDEGWSAAWPTHYVVWMEGRISSLELHAPPEGDNYAEWDIDTLLDRSAAEAIALMQDPASEGALTGLNTADLKL